MTSAVYVCNLALDELPHHTITSLNDNVRAAEVCKRQLPAVLGEIMESAEWGFAIKREPLSYIDNDRTGYWGYAYATPNDMAMPIRIWPAPYGVTAPTLQPGQRLAASYAGSPDSITFDFEGLKLWTDEPGAMLEYVVTTPAYTAMTYKFRRVLAVMLAARLAVPIKQDARRKSELLSEAELLRQRAVAGDLNRNATQNTYGNDFMPDALAAMTGVLEGGMRYGGVGGGAAVVPSGGSSDGTPYDFEGIVE